MEGISQIYNQILSRSGSISADEIQGLIQSNEEIGLAFHINDAESAVAIKQGRPMEGTRSVTMFDDVAVISLIGPIFPRSNMMTMSSDGMSLESFCKDFATAYLNPGVKAMVINSDSPGGDARGLADAADFIFDLTQKTKKPLVSFASGYMASAAYYLSAPAHKIVSSKSGQVGSIGTVIKASRRDDGTFDITSSISPKKRPDMNTEEGISVLQQVVDDLGNQFAQDVARYRGVSFEKVVADYGQGSYMFGPRAKAQGLVDSIGTLASTVQMASKMAEDKSGASFRRKPKADLDDTQIESSADIFHFSEDTNMRLKDIVSKLLPTSAVLDGAGTEESTDGTVPVPPVTEEAVEAELPVIVPTRDELEEAHGIAAQLFSTEMVLGHHILPALQGLAASDFINAAIDDQLYPAEITFVNAEGEVVTGSREGSIRARYSAMKPHTMTQEAIAGVKAGTVVAKVLPAIDPEKVTEATAMTAERRREVLGLSDQGQSVLASEKV